MSMDNDSRLILAAFEQAKDRAARERATMTVYSGIRDGKRVVYVRNAEEGVPDDCDHQVVEGRVYQNGTATF